MKLYKNISKKNIKAKGLTTVLLAIVMLGSGLSLARCSAEYKENKLGEPKLQTEIESPKINPIKENWYMYIKRLYELKKELGLEECFMNDYDTINDIIKVLKEQEKSNKSIEYIKYGNLIYTSDKKICYDTKLKRLQISFKEANENVLKTYWSFNQDKYELGKDNKKIETEVVYDSKNNNLEFNQILPDSGLTHNYSNMPIYIFLKIDIRDLNKEELAKHFICYDNQKPGNFDKSFYGRCSYNIFKHDSYSSRNFEISYETHLENISHIYNNDENMMKEFNDLFDNRNIDILNNYIYDFYNSSTKETEYVLKK